MIQQWFNIIKTRMAQEEFVIWHLDSQIRIKKDPSRSGITFSLNHDSFFINVLAHLNRFFARLGVLFGDDFAILRHFFSVKVIHKSYITNFRSKLNSRLKVWKTPVR